MKQLKLRNKLEKQKRLVEKVLQSNQRILKEIFKFVGLDCWLFIAPVSKSWYKIYGTLCDYKGEGKKKTEVRSTLLNLNSFEYGLRNGLTISPGTIERVKRSLGIKNLCMGALKFGKVDIVNCIVNTMPSEVILTSEFAVVAAYYGHVSLLEWCFERRCAWDWKIAGFAGLNGHLHVLNFLYHLNYPIDGRVSILAALNDRTEVLNWMRNNGYAWNDWRIFEAALSKNHWDVIYWALKNQCQVLQFTLRRMIIAAKRSCCSSKGVYIRTRNCENMHRSMKLIKERLLRTKNF